MRPGRGRVLLQARHPQSEKPLAPTRGLLRGDSQFGGDFFILFSGGRQQHNPRAFDQTNRQRSRPRALLQRFLLFRSQDEWGSNAHREEPLYCRDVLSADNDYYFRRTTLAVQLQPVHDHLSKVFKCDLGWLQLKLRT